MVFTGVARCRPSPRAELAPRTKLRAERRLLKRKRRGALLAGRVSASPLTRDDDDESAPSQQTHTAAVRGSETSKAMIRPPLATWTRTQAFKMPCGSLNDNTEIASNEGFDTMKHFVCCRVAPDDKMQARLFLKLSPQLCLADFVFSKEMRDCQPW